MPKKMTKEESDTLNEKLWRIMSMRYGGDPEPKKPKQSLWSKIRRRHA